MIEGGAASEWKDATVIGVSFAVATGAGVLLIGLLLLLKRCRSNRCNQRDKLSMSAARAEVSDDTAVATDAEDQPGVLGMRSLAQLASTAAMVSAFFSDHFTGFGEDDLETSSHGSSSISSHDSFTEKSGYRSSLSSNIRIELDFEVEGFDDPLAESSRRTIGKGRFGSGGKISPIVLSPLYARHDNFAERCNVYPNDEELGWEKHMFQLSPTESATTETFYKAHGISMCRSMFVGSVPPSSSSCSSSSSSEEERYSDSSSEFD